MELHASVRSARLVAGNALPGAPTHAGVWTATASFAGSGDYLPAGSSTPFTVAQATATLSLSDGGGPSDWRRSTS